jgi:hypothetical protein
MALVAEREDDNASLAKFFAVAQEGHSIVLEVYVVPPPPPPTHPPSPNPRQVTQAPTPSHRWCARTAHVL